MSHHDTRKQIDALLAVAGSTDKARQILELLGVQAGAWYLDQCDQVAFARHLLQQRTPRSEIAERLQQRFKISERSAYRRSEDALNKHSQK